MEPPGIPETEYYRSVGRKIGDFCLGFFGMILATIAVEIPVAILADVIDSGFIPTIGLLAIPVIIAVGAVHFFRKRRRFIAIGMISVIIVPFLAVGACFLVLITAFG